MAFADLLAFDCARARLVCGADEAGRGCFAGPLVAAAVRFDYDRLPDEAMGDLAALDDSKKLTAKTRQRLYPLVWRHADQVAVVLRSAKTIDERGLHKTNLAANYGALTLVARPGAALLADGFALPAVEGQAVERVVRGDSQSAAIAAASVVAKVSRDRLMARLATVHPGYGFEQHAGYGTKAHRTALAELGLTPQHRRSFAGVG